MPSPTVKNTKRRKIIAGVVVLLIAAGAGVYFGYFRKKEGPVEVQTEKVVRRDITELVVANGRVQPVVQVVIQPEVSGEIIDLPVKEGQDVKKGDVLVRIKPDNYQAARNSSEANYKSALAGMNLAQANLEKARLEFKRIEQLFKDKLVSDSQYLEGKTTMDVAAASHETSTHQVAQAKAMLARADDDLAKTTIKAPIDGTVTNLRSQQGERVVGTAMMAGTEIMTVAKLDQIEARVDIGEIDVVLIQVGQKARMEVEAFRDRKFNGVVTEIANAAKGTTGAMQSGGGMGSQNQEATKFQVKILLQEKEQFRPGMSVSAEIETRARTNVLAVPIMSVTTRAPQEPEKPAGQREEAKTGLQAKIQKKDEVPKAKEIVFLADGDVAKSAEVKIGIMDDNYIEVIEGVKEGQEVVSGGYAAISRQLEDGKKIKRGDPEADKKKKNGNKTT